MKISLNPVSFWKKQISKLKGDLDTSVEAAARVYSANLKVIRQRRSEPAVEEMSFSKMLLSWGIAEDEINTVIKGMNKERYAMLALFLIIAFPMVSNDELYIPAIIGAGLLGLVAAMVWITRAWRMHCLKERAFIPFKKWMGIK